MFYALVAVVLGSLAVSAICSLVEAAIYAVPVSHVKALADSGSKAGLALQRFKEDIARPISLILLINTMANALGPLVCGWLVGELFENSGYAVGIFSLGFAAAILIIGELIPKTAGVVYCKPVSTVAALPISFLIKLFYPLIRFSEIIHQLLPHNEDAPTVSHEEVLSMAAIGTEEGALDDFEGSVISNVIGLDKLLVKDVLTPRVVVFRLAETTAVGALKNEITGWQFTRIPIFSVEDPDHLTGYVTQRDIYRVLIEGNEQQSLKELARELQTVPELMRVDKLLLRMFEQKEHICAVADEHGSLAGIITLEDIIEEIVGKEIVDEYDAVSDLRSYAKILRVAKRRNRPTRKENIDPQ
ncbi:MAG: hemolysin family protein [Oligoflexia bacterium]|nr:hemolysin family protein [Oligoflexia bacterium]